jgi:hypothetical protein
MAKRYGVWRLALLGLLFGGCAGMQRSCSAGCASDWGADWVVAQYDMAGHPYRCWELHGTSIDNEGASDGVYWLSPDGHLVHISGTYNRVQVEGGQWDSAYRELGLTAEECARLTGLGPVSP